MKRILFFAFIWAMVFLIAACSKGGDAAKQSDPGGRASPRRRGDVRGNGRRS